MSLGRTEGITTSTELPSKPIRPGLSVFAKTLALVFVAEFAVMLFLDWVDLSWGLNLALLDAVLLTLLIAPPLIFLIVQPAARAAAQVAAAERFRGLLESLPLPVRVIQGEVVVYSNHADAELFGFGSPTDIIGTGAFSCVADGDVARLRKYATQRAAGEAVANHYEARGKSRDGTPIPLEIFVENVDYAGQPASLVVLRDSRERKRLELLQSILPVCSLCGKIRDDNGTEPGQGSWSSLAEYLQRCSRTRFSHGFCPDCYRAYRVQQGLSAEPPSKPGS